MKQPGKKLWMRRDCLCPWFAMCHHARAWAVRLRETDLMSCPAGTQAQPGRTPTLYWGFWLEDVLSWIRHHPGSQVRWVGLLELRCQQGTETSPQRITIMRSDSGLGTLPAACSHPSHMHRSSERHLEIFPAFSVAMTC